MEKIKRIIAYPNIGLITLAYIAFIALGMPDGLLGVAWPSIRTDFSIPLDAVGILILASVIGYLTSSFLSGLLVSHLGIGKVLSISCAMTGIALLSYTLVSDWWMMVLLGVMSGLGAGAIDAGLNGFVAANFSERLMQWLHASYGIGITFGPIIMTLSLSMLNSWRIGYRVVAVFQLVLAICFLVTLPSWNLKKSSVIDDDPKPQLVKNTLFFKTLRKPQVWLSMLLFFLYVGCEVSFGTWTYSLLTESRGIDPSLAGYFVSSYWATFTIGRIIAGIFVKKISVHALVQGSMAVALCGTILLIWNPSVTVNLLAVALIGFAIAPIFPSLMSTTKDRVGTDLSTNTVGMQIASSGLGTVVIPSILGMLARKFSLEVIPICLIVIFSLLFCVYRISLIKTEKTVKGSI